MGLELRVQVFFLQFYPIEVWKVKFLTGIDLNKECNNCFWCRICC